MDTNFLDIGASRFKKIQKAKRDIIDNMIRNGVDVPLNEFTVIDYGFGDELTKDIIITCILESIEDEAVERDEVTASTGINFVDGVYTVSLPNRFQWFKPGWFELYREVELDIYSGMVIESGSLPGEYIETSLISEEKFHNSDEMFTFVEWVVSDLKGKGWFVEPSFLTEIAYHGTPILDAGNNNVFSIDHRFRSGLPETTQEILDGILGTALEKLASSFKNPVDSGLSIHKFQSVTLFLKPE